MTIRSSIDYRVFTHSFRPFSYSSKSCEVDGNYASVETVGFHYIRICLMIAQARPFPDDSEVARTRNDHETAPTTNYRSVIS